MLNEFLQQIDQLERNQKILEHLKEMYLLLKNQTQYENLFSPDELNSTESHVKKLIINEKSKHGTLKFEVMFFTGKKYTPTHTHPEFVIDEVVNGRLKEKIYKCIGEGKYEFEREEVRNVGDLRLINCDQGYPHEVIGLDEKNITLCLSLGHDKVEPICESKII